MSILQPRAMIHSVLTRCRWILALIWLAFLVRGAFYSRFIPLWEGYDEWSHYAFLEHFRFHGGALPLSSDGVSEEIRQSVESGEFKHEETEPLKLYEAQQPPLYYWILYLPNRIFSDAPIAVRVHRLRLFSILIASLVIPLAYLAARQLFYSRRIALAVCALIASMPELMIDVARVGNECLSIALASWIVLLLLRKKAPALGLAMGLALLTKAYFLAFLPILVIRRRFYSLGAALAISGWWYWRSFHLTGTLSGEVLDVVAAHMGLGARLHMIGKVNWFSVLDAAAWTHIWNGAWSFFSLRSWMYRIFELLFVVAVVMLLRTLLKRPMGIFKSKIALLASLEALFAAGMSWQTLATFLAKGISFSGGWYYYVLVTAEALLLASGAMIFAGRRRVIWAITFLTTLYAALDLYGVNVVLAKHYHDTASIPYVIATLALIILSAVW